MLILALDTTSETGGVGIFRDAECLALVPNQGPARGFSVSLFEMAEQALAQARTELRAIDLFAVANGPGSFTGIRVGLAAARAWGKAFDRPVRGVSVLEALVYKAGLGAGDSGLGETPARPVATPQPMEPHWCFPILDARRGEFYVGAFRRKHSTLPNALGPEYEAADGGWVLSPESLRSLVEERLAGAISATCVVRAHDQVATGLRAALPPSLGWQQIAGPLVDAVAAIARQEEQSQRPRTDAQLDAYYIRRPDAEVNRKGE